jgi:FkbM family methyltransferase
VLEEVFFDGEYDLARTLDRQQIRTVVDLGANVGYSVVIWKQLFLHARVIAVEPDPGNLAVCRRNVHGLPHVTIVEGCVSGQTKRVTLDRSSGEEWGFRIGQTVSPADDLSVQAYSMPDLLRSFAGGLVEIDLLKCDIEGAEADVFADCRDWIGRVRHMIIELHHPYRSAAFLADLDRAGARVDASTITVQEFGNHEVLYLELARP